MKFRLATSLGAALAIWAGNASAAPQDASAPENRMDAIAARMVRGESYDQATRATLPGSRSNVRLDVYLARTSRLDSYDQAANAARSGASEDADAVNSRWETHLAQMQELKTHEAGWAATASR